MLGEIVRESRIKKSLTQAKLARLAGVSRRHLAALEKGANVSINVLKKVAAVLDLAEIQLGSLSLRTGDAADPAFNVPLISDTIREARAGAVHAESLLARAEALLEGREQPQPKAVAAPELAPLIYFPPLAPRRLDVRPRKGTGTAVADRAEWLEIETAGELRQGEPVDETKKESIVLPSSLIESGEQVFRVRGDSLNELGLDDGDILITQNRTKGRAATAELVLGRINGNIYVGRWWQKNERRALLTEKMAEVTVGKANGSLKIVAVVNAIIRPIRR